MYESISIVGERGQITIPKASREKEKIKAGEKVIVKIEDKKIVVEKILKKQKQDLLKEGYLQTAKLDLETEKDWASASAEADAMIDDY